MSGIEKTIIDIFFLSYNNTTVLKRMPCPNWKGENNVSNIIINIVNSNCNKSLTMSIVLVNDVSSLQLSNAYIGKLVFIEPCCGHTGNNPNALSLFNSFTPI